MSINTLSFSGGSTPPPQQSRVNPKVAQQREGVKPFPRNVEETTQYIKTWNLPPYFEELTLAELKKFFEKTAGKDGFLGGFGLYGSDTDRLNFKTYHSLSYTLGKRPGQITLPSEELAAHVQNTLEPHTRMLDNSSWPYSEGYPLRVPNGLLRYNADADLWICSNIVDDPRLSETSFEQNIKNTFGGLTDIVKAHRDFLTEETEPNQEKKKVFFALS